MARGRRRTISRRDFESDLPPWIREVRLAIKAHADDYGHAPASPQWIRAQAYARVAAKDLPNIEAALVELELRRALTIFRDSKGERWIELVEWDDDQKVNHPGRALYPGPEETGAMSETFKRVLSEWYAAWREEYKDDYVEKASDRKQLGVFLRRLPRPDLVDILPEVFRAYLRDKSDPWVVRRTHPLTWFCTSGAFNTYREAIRKDKDKASDRNNDRPVASRRAPSWWSPAPSGGSR